MDMLCHHWKQWWRRSPDTCCSKKILLLVVWQTLLVFSCRMPLLYRPIQISVHLGLAFNFVIVMLAPIIGWLADVRFGRYAVIKFSSLLSFPVSILLYLALLTGGRSLLSTLLYSAALVLQLICLTCFAAAMLPFITDQLIGATSDELSAVVQWYVWGYSLGLSLAEAIAFLVIAPNYEVINVGLAGIVAVPLAVIIISDCLCQQWLDRTHKVTNPIKLIIQVLNYTRKHRYPERRSAFTYIDEEQPSRIDYGKKKFGGPFTEEEVEDVKTVLRLIPLLICLSLFEAADVLPENLFEPKTTLYKALNIEIDARLFLILVIPVYRFLLHRYIHRYTPSMLNSLAIGLALCLVGYITLEVLVIKGVVDSDIAQSYLSCNITATRPAYYVEWYWKIGPYLLYGIGKTILKVLLYELTIAQSPDKMKGLIIGIMLAFRGSEFIFGEFRMKFKFTLCYDVSMTVLLVILLVIFLILSKCYTLRERNREINIQAIVEEHYERYMDQEEEYMKQQHY